MTRSNALILSLITAAGCIGQEDPLDMPHGRILSGEAGWVEYKPNVRFLEEARGYQSVEIEPVGEQTQMTFHFAGTPDVQLQPGDVLVGQHAPSYMSKVVSARIEGTTLDVITEPASLRDAVAQADISAFVPVTEDGLAPVLYEPVAAGAPPLRPRPDLAPTETAFASAASALSSSKDVTVTPFNLANRELLQVSVFGATLKLPLSIKTTSDSYLRVSGGYTVRLSIDADDIYFRTDLRGGVDLNLGVTVSGSMTDSATLAVFNGNLAGFSLYGIPGGLKLDVDATVKSAITLPSLTTGLTLSRDASLYVAYDSAAMTPWTKGGSGSGPGITYKPLKVNATTSGTLRFGLRTTISAELGGVADIVPLGVKLDSTASITAHPEYVITVTAGSPADYEIDVCRSLKAGVSNKISWFLNQLPGFSFDDINVSSTSFGKSWSLEASSCDVVAKS